MLHNMARIYNILESFSVVTEYCLSFTRTFQHLSNSTFCNNSTRKFKEFLTSSKVPWGP